MAECLKSLPKLWELLSLEKVCDVERGSSPRPIKQYLTSSENGVNWIKQLEMNPEEILMIGDTDHDFEVAIAMEVDCILLSHGHNCVSKLQNTGAMVINDLMELSGLFKIELNEIK